MQRTLYELIKGLQDSERQVDSIISRIPAAFKDQTHRQRVEALQFVLDDMPTDMGERVIE